MAGRISWRGGENADKIFSSSSSVFSKTHSARLNRCYWIPHLGENYPPSRFRCNSYFQNQTLSFALIECAAERDERYLLYLTAKIL